MARGGSCRTSRRTRHAKPRQSSYQRSWMPRDENDVSELLQATARAGTFSVSLSSRYPFLVVRSPAPAGHTAIMVNISDKIKE